MVLFSALIVRHEAVAADAKEGIHLDLPADNERLPTSRRQEKDPAAELAEIQEKINKGELPKIEFDFDSAKIRKDSFPTLDAIANLLLRDPEHKLLITAHTCNIGSAEYNLRLSYRRAKSVKGYLVKQGVPPPSIRFRGKGFSEPIADNGTEAGRIKNRRVEFNLLKRWWSSVY